MRKIILMITILIFSNQLDAQKKFKSRAGKYQWCYQHFSFGVLTATFYDKIDTIPNDTSRVQVFNGFLRDTNNQVYFKSISSLDTEKIIYDFNLIVGDTFKTTIPNKGLVKFIVTKRDKVKIETDSLVRLELRNVSGLGSNLTWVESIGCIQLSRPFDWTFYYDILDNFYSLKCVENQDRISILKSLGKDCYVTDFFNSKKSWNTWISELNGDYKYDVKFTYQNRDTVINGLKYKFMNNNTQARFDSISGKYYLISNNNGIEYFIYNENAKIGDTISNFPMYNPQLVKEIDIIRLENDFIKVYTTQNDKYQSNLGSIKKVFWDNHIKMVSEYQAGNFCFDEIFPMLNYKYKFADYYLKNSCSANSGINENEFDNIQIQIQNSKLYLSQIPLTNTPYSIRIFNLQGQELFQSKISKNAEQVFDLEFNHGIFILQIISNQSIISKKIEL